MVRLIHFLPCSMTHQYDFLIGVYGPHFALKLCHDLHRKFGVRYILDMRDLL